jgi:ribosomal protein L37E
MSAFICACRRCGREFEADRQTILAGTWRTCPGCRATPPPDPQATACRQCGRSLRHTTRTLCVGCLMGGSPL